LALCYDVITPFAGTIDRIFIRSGDRVEEGGVLFALMSNGITHDILSPVTGFSDSIEVASGDYVISGMILTRIIEK
jgi:biotin carboxyl carrier protein